MVDNHTTKEEKDMKKIRTMIAMMILLCSCKSESTYVENEMETTKEEYEIVLLDDNGEAKEQKTMNYEDAKQYLEFISVNFHEVDASDESKRAITTDVYAYEKLTYTMEDSYTTKIVMDWVYVLTQSSVWYRNEYRIHDLCFARYTINENGQYEIYSDYTWEQVKNFTNLYQRKVNSFEYEIHSYEGETVNE